MPFPSVRRAAICFCLGFFLAIPAAAIAQTNYYGAYGTEYGPIGSLPGDQVFPDVAINSQGGYIVWQDNITQPVGTGISATRLNSTLSGSGDVFEVNVPNTNSMSHAHVALLKNGGAVFVWEGGVPTADHIHARFLNASNIWMTATNVTVSTFLGYGFQESPAVAVLTNGDVIVVWDNYNLNSSTMCDVYGQLFTANGTSIGTNFLINVFTKYNQRNPVVSALKNGGFVVAWVSEQERQVGTTNQFDALPSQIATPGADIYERLYTVSNTTVKASTGEILVNGDNNPCARPAIATASDGSYMVTWCANNLANSADGWDIYERSFTNSNGGQVYLVNSHTYGDQYAPRISVIYGDYMIVWTSLGQDGSREGVYGQFIHEGDSPVNGEFRINTTTLGQQMQPAVASDGAEQFLTVWTSFTFGPNGFDLYAQRYMNAGAVLEPMGAPFVWAPFVVSNGVYQPELCVSWPPVQGLSVSNYEVFVNGAGTNTATVTGDAWTMTAANGLTTQSTNSFALEYRTSTGYLSPISPSATGSTWLGYYWGSPPNCIPVEWMAEYYGNNQSLWPAANAPMASGGPTLWQIFNTGGNPTNSATWLKTTLTMTAKGAYLNWNTQPGMTYQVQSSSALSGWQNYGAPRFESGTSDTIFVGSGGSCFYRVQLLQQ